MPGFIGQHLPTAYINNPPLGSTTLFFDNGGTLVMKRSDGSVVSVGASGSFTFSVTQSVSPSSFVTDMTYQQYMTELVIGLTPSYYRITDFKTRGYILGGGLTDTYTGVTESLIVFASGTQSFPYALSETFPQDEIHYDPYGVNWKDDLSFSTDGANLISDFKGVIYYRKDTKRDVSASYDWRNALIRRWKVDETSMGLTAWASGVTWSRGDFVEDNNGAMYYCLEEHTSPGGTGPTAFNPNSYYAGINGWVDGQLNRKNNRYHWLRLWKKDLYIVPAWKQGATLSSTHSITVGRHSDAAKSYYVIDIPIDLSSHQDGNIFYQQGATPSINEKLDGVRIHMAPDISKDNFGSIVLTHRIDTQRPIINLDIRGTGLTFYDRTPIILPNGPFNNGNEQFIYNEFKDITDFFMYGDEEVTSLTSDITPLWQDNKFTYNSWVFGYAQGADVKTNLSSLFEEIVIAKGIYYGTSVRHCTLIDIANISILSYMQDCSTVNIGQSQQDRLISIYRTDIIDSEENTFGINFNTYLNSSNNELGPEFERNSIGGGGIKDTMISSGCKDNYFYGIRDCNIESDFTFNVGASNSVSPDDDIFEHNNVASEISSMNFSSSSYVYSPYSKNIVKTPGGTVRLTYLNNGFTFSVVDPTT